MNVTSLADMETLFDGIALGGITTSMTINSPAAMIFAMYLVVAEQQGADWATLSGTIQNDILKEFIAQKEYIFPPRPSMRLITDVFAFCSREVPAWNTISVSGYHIREAGATAAQELAFTLRDGIEYVQWGVDAGLAVDSFVPRMSFFHAQRRFTSRDRVVQTVRRSGRKRAILGAKSERSWKLRFHAQTAGVSLTSQQPYNNVVRTALQAMAAVLGGTNSLHTNSLGRSAGAADRRSGHARAQDPADHRVRKRRDRDRRRARRFVLRREADERHGRRGEGVFRRDRSDGRHGRGDRARLSAAGDCGERVSLSAGRRAQGKGHRRRQRLRAGDEPPIETLYIDESAGDTQLAKAREAGRRGMAIVGARSIGCATPQRPTAT